MEEYVYQLIANKPTVEGSGEQEQQPEEAEEAEEEAVVELERKVRVKKTKVVKDCIQE